MIRGYAQLPAPGFQRQADVFQMRVNLFFTDAQGTGQLTGILRFFF